MALTASLFALEQLDTDIDGREGAIRDARRRIGRNSELEAAEARLEALRARAQTATSEQRTAEGEIADLDARIKRDHSRLYSGQVVDSREIASLERELEHYRTRKDELEDHCLAVMERVETLQAEIDGLSARANALRERWEADRSGLTRQVQWMTDELAGLRSERERLAATIDPRALDSYTRMRKSLGHAVSEVTGGVCAMCRVAIPAKDIQHARSGTGIVQCPNCSRILFVGTPVVPPHPPAPSPSRGEGE
jgi:predicted  nucleic acid-binding Zn-ribbon protein